MICIVSAIWQRPELTKIFLRSLRRYWDDWGIMSVVAGSEGVKTRELCLDHGVHYVEAKNQPISGKFIKASHVAFAMKDVTNIIILGSDDFIDDRLIENYNKLVDFDLVGIKDCYFYNLPSKEGAYWRGYTNFREGEPIGMARMLSKNAYSKLKGKLWPSNMNSGLDYTMMQRLKKVRTLKRKVLAIKDTGMAVDFKGKGNISGFDCYRSNMTEVEDSTFNVIPEFSEIQKL